MFNLKSSKIMKKIFSLFAAVLFTGSMMATTATWTASSGKLGSSAPGSGTITDSEDNVWNYSRTLIDGASYTGWGYSYIQLGKNGGVENITFTTSEISGVIESVSIDCASYQGKHNVSITVGDATYLASTAVPTWSSNTGGVKTGTGSASGEITITITGGTRALYVKSISVTYTEGAVTKVAKPKFSLEAGKYEGAQNVEISCKTEGATIYYTLDGTDPTTASTVYSAAIPVAATTTIKAFAAKADLDNSDIASATYTIVPGADVVLDFTDNTEWGFPSDAKTTAENTYTCGDYSIKVSAGAQYYTNCLLVGKTDAYIKLPVFADKAIARIATPAESTGAAGVTFNIYAGENAVSTEATNCKEEHTFDISPKAKNVEYMIKITNENNARFNKIKIWFGEADPATAIDNTELEGKAVKAIENGQLVIIKNGVRYNALGNVIR